MFHGMKNTILYTAYKLYCEYEKNSSDKIQTVGTCFVVESKYRHPCVITNIHLIIPSFSNKKYVGYKLINARLVGKKDTDGFKGDAKVNQEIDLRTELFVFPENELVDVSACPLIIKKEKYQVMEYHVPFNLIANEKFINELEICDFIPIPGFPEWHDREADRPIMRVGNITSDQRLNYKVKNKFMGDVILYDGFSYPGNSGSPVFSFQRGIKGTPQFPVSGFRELALIGINAGHYSTERGDHPGLSYFYRSTDFLKLIDAEIIFE